MSRDSVDLMAPLQRSLGICPRCGRKFTDKGAMASLTALVQLHEALDCGGRA